MRKRLGKAIRENAASCRPSYGSILEGFKYPARIKILTEDLVLYRSFYGGVRPNLRGFLEERLYEKEIG